MAIAERTAVAALRHRLHQGRALVQRIWRQAEHDRALRPEDGKVPELGDPRRRRHRAQHERNARRQPGDREQPGQSGRTGRGEIGLKILESWRRSPLIHAKAGIKNRLRGIRDMGSRFSWGEWILMYDDYSIS